MHGRESVSAMQLDFDKYRPYVDAFDMSEARKIELIEIVSNMMRGFVDLDSAGVKSDHHLTSIFNQTAEQRGEDENHE